MLRDTSRNNADVALVDMKPMRIEVVGKDESSNAQARTYAEYRLLATLARYRQRVRGARIILRRGKRNGACDTVVCAVIVALDPAGTVRARFREGHAYAAINRTVERIGYLMRDAVVAPEWSVKFKLDRVAVRWPARSKRVPSANTKEIDYGQDEAAIKDQRQ